MALVSHRDDRLMWVLWAIAWKHTWASQVMSDLWTSVGVAPLLVQRANIGPADSECRDSLLGQVLGLLRLENVVKDSVLMFPVHEDFRDS